MTSGKLFLRLLLLCIVITAGNQIFAQQIWGSYTHAINVSKFSGKPFRMQAMVQTKISDDSAAAYLWLRVTKKDGMGFFYNMAKEPIRTKEWKLYEIKGTIDTGAVTLNLGMYCTYNGEFFLDDLKLEIQQSSGEWVNAFTADFNNGKIPFEPGIGGGADGKNASFKASIVAGYKGTKSLRIAANNIPVYGMDKKAGKYAGVNGIKLYYEVYGSGQPLLVLHGNGGSIASASDFYPELMKKYKVIAIDSRAQGRSGDTDAPLTYDQMASDINALLEQLQIDSVYIWGQSDGAILGLLMAKDYPKKTKKVVAFGSNIQPDSNAIFQWAIDGGEKILRESKDPKERKLNQLMQDYPQLPYDELSKIQAPVLVVAGDRDVIRPEHTLKIFQHIKNSQLFIIPGSTHGAAWENKELFLKVMENFFDKPFKMPDTKDWYN